MAAFGHDIAINHGMINTTEFDGHEKEQPQQ